MRKLRDIRNRLTHPRKAEDLHLANDDLAHVLAGADWFKQTMLDLFDACAEADRAYRARGGGPPLNE